MNAKSEAVDIPTQQVSERRPEIVVVGGHVQGMFIRVERLPGPDETVLGWGYDEPEDGGKGSHQAIACSRLGATTAFVGCIGLDRLGDRALTWLQQAGVDSNYVTQTTTAATGIGFVMIDPHGTPAIVSVLGANADLSEAHLDRSEPMLKHANVLLVSLEISVETALHAIRIGSKFGLRVILNPAPAAALLGKEIEGVDVLTPNLVEARQLLGEENGTSPAELARALQRHFRIPNVIITLGNKGASVVERDRSYHVPAFAVRAVDTVGAGDAFNAGLAVALARGTSVEEAVRTGSLVAACAVTRPGSLPSFPILSVLQEFAGQYGFTMPTFLSMA